MITDVASTSTSASMCNKKIITAILATIVVETKTQKAILIGKIKIL